MHKNIKWLRSILNSSTAVKTATLDQLIPSIPSIHLNTMEHAHMSTEGKQVNTVGSIHKHHKTGTFAETCGQKMATVQTDGEKERSVLLSSIAPTPPSKKTANDIVLSQAACQELTQKIMALVGALDCLQVKVKMFHKRIN